MVTCCDYIFFMRDTYIRRLAREPVSKGHTGGRSRKIAQPAGPLLRTTIIKSDFVHERLIVPTQDYVLYK